MRNDQRSLFHTYAILLSSTFLLVSLSGCVDELIYDKCIAQTGSLSNGKGGGSAFPGSMRKSQCEEKCTPIRAAAIAEPTWGYCRFGNDYLWEENRDREVADQTAFMQDVQERFEAAMYPRNTHFCNVEIYNSGDFNDLHEEWDNVQSAHRCKNKCEPYMAKARSLGASAVCYLGDDLLSSVDTDLGDSSDIYE